MIGVMLWKNPKGGTGLIWCEDQADLAYLAGPEAIEADYGWPEVGDLVELECSRYSGLRLGHKVRVIDPRHHPEIADTLIAAVRPKAPEAPPARPRPDWLRVVG